MRNILHLVLLDLLLGSIILFIMLESIWNVNKKGSYRVGSNMEKKGVYSIFGLILLYFLLHIFIHNYVIRRICICVVVDWNQVKNIWKLAHSRWLTLNHCVSWNLTSGLEQYLYRPRPFSHHLATSINSHLSHLLNFL